MKLNPYFKNWVAYLPLMTHQADTGKITCAENRDSFNRRQLITQIWYRAVSQKLVRIEYLLYCEPVTHLIWSCFLKEQIEALFFSSQSLVYSKSFWGGRPHNWVGIWLTWAHQANPCLLSDSAPRMEAAISQHANRNIIWTSGLGKIAILFTPLCTTFSPRLKKKNSINL